MNLSLSFSPPRVALIVATLPLLAMPMMTGCASSDGPAYAAATYSSPGVEVSISTVDDFYEPLSPYGEWVVVGSYGRCWRPRGVVAEWRPYSEGHWEWTDAGWYWVSDEPWGWATCHYGRWDMGDDGAWFWIPQTEWAPAWVEWREGDGYIGWAPVPPAGRSIRRQPQAYVFVEERHFVEPVRPRTVIVNNTTIINRTVNITNTRVVNQTVINQGPRLEAITQRTGRTLAATPVRQLRTREEAKIERRPRTAPSTGQTQNRPYRTPSLSPSERVPAQASRPAAPQEAQRVAPALEDDRAVERSAKERADRERSAAEHAAQERAAQERATAETARREQAERNRAANERKEAEQAARERAAAERENAERAEKARQANERAIAEHPRTERPAPDREVVAPAAQQRATPPPNAEPHVPPPQSQGDERRQNPPGQKKPKPAKNDRDDDQHGRDK